MAGEERPTPAHPNAAPPTPLGVGAMDAQKPHDPLAHAAQARPSYQLLDDATLIEHAKGEPEAFGVLYERYVRAVFTFAFSKVRDTALAEDITSQTFLQALRALPRYQQRGVPIRSWLFRITANLITDRHRSPISEQPLHAALGHPHDDETPTDLPDPRAEEDITAWEQAQDFARMIEDLTPEQRTVVRLRFAEGLSMAQIAGQTGRSEGAIKMLLMRGLQNLRRRMATETANAG
jgi:RNA polymerase sigma-70 factor, ECF subfamily